MPPPEKSTPITCVGLLENQLLVTEVEELVELFRVFETHHQVLGCECLLPIATVGVLQVDLVQQF